jgi:hypothetical protein
MSATTSAIRIATTSAFALDVQDQYNTSHLTVNTASTTGNVFTVASSTGTTLFTITQAGLASTTNLMISGIGSGATKCLHADATGNVTEAGADCAAGGSVTSVATANGIIGGTFTTSGTVSLQSYISTSSLETATRIPTWNTTSGTPAQLTGGFSGYTLTSTKLTATNASTTAFTASGELGAPNSTTASTDTVAGDVFINTNGTASSSIQIPDGTHINTIFATHSMGMTVASSSLSYAGSYGASGTTTLTIANPLHASTLQSFYCSTDVGTAWVGFQFGAGTETTEVQCTTSGAGVTLSSNNTGTGRQAVKVNIGHEATNPNLITITADVEDKN